MKNSRLVTSPELTSTYKIGPTNPSAIRFVAVPCKFHEPGPTTKSKLPSPALVDESWVDSFEIISATFATELVFSSTTRPLTCEAAAGLANKSTAAKRAAKRKTVRDRERFMRWKRRGTFNVGGQRP